MRTIFLDIETLHCDPADFTPTPDEAPSNYKDPEKIAAYIAAKEAEQLARTSLDSHQGRLLCIGAAVDDEPPACVYDRPPGDMLDWLAERVDCNLDRDGDLLLVGHNITGFDLPWLWRLAVRERHPVASMLPWARYGGRHVADTMQLWSLPSPERISLDTICRFLGIPGKGDFGGKDVAAAYARGEHERIQTYCMADVERVRAVYRRLPASVKP